MELRRPFVCILLPQIASRRRVSLQSSRSSVNIRQLMQGGSVYLCPHPKCQTPPFFAQSPSGVYSHIRRKHLGIALAFPYCADKVYWNSKGWNAHMNTEHHNAPHFGTALADEASLTQEMFRTMELHSAPSASASKKCRVRKKPTQLSQKRTSPESSSSVSGSDEGTVDSSPDFPSSSRDTSDIETAGVSKSSKCQTKSESPFINQPMAQELNPGLEDMPRPGGGASRSFPSPVSHYPC